MTRENKLGVMANLIIVMLISSSIGQTLYTSLFTTKTPSSLIFLTVIPFTLLFFIMFRNRISTMVSLIVLVAVLAGGCSIIIFKTGIESALVWANNYSIWFIDITNGYNDVAIPLFTNLTIMVISLFATFFVYIFTFKISNFFVTTIIFFSVFYIQLEFDTKGSDFSFVLFILSFLMYYFFYILRRRDSEKTYDVGNKLKYLIYILPVCIAILLMSFLLFPTQQDRIEITWLDTRINKTVDTIVDAVVNKFSDVDVSSFDYFSFGVSGFGKTDRLGGNLKPNNVNVMNVESDHSNLYLRATSKANYDGHRWYDADNNFSSIGTEKEYTKQVSSDAVRLIDGIKLSLNGVSGLDIDKNDFFVDSKAAVEFKNMKTKSLFIPNKTYNLNLKSNQEILMDKEQMLSVKELKGKGFSYSFSYYSLNLKSEKLIALLRESHSTVNKSSAYYDNNNKLETATNVRSIDSIEVKEIPSYVNAEKIDSINKKYTQLPVTITPRVRALAEELTKDKNNRYDMAKAIETYLSRNYPYTLTPGNAPRSKDFVDYFLFEGKKGYCTYYASAMTVLLRCMDIPARYVEGYILPPERTKGVFQVTTQQAHAWVEVYFDDYGWIPFEPTSPFVANLYEDRTISATMSSEMQDTSYQDYMAMMNKYRDPYASVTYNPANLTPTKSGMKTPILILIIVASFLGLILLTVCTIASINYFRFYNLIRRIRKSDPNSGMLTAYEYIIKALKFHGVYITPGETPSQFGERVEKAFDIKSYSFNKTSFTKISEYYIKARYSRNNLSTDDIEQTLEFINVLLELIAEKSGRIKFGFSRYFLGRV